MKKLLMIWCLCLPLTVMAQNETDRVAALQAEAAAKAKAAQEAAKAAQEAARAAQEAAEAAAAEAERVAKQAEMTQQADPSQTEQPRPTVQPKPQEQPKPAVEQPAPSSQAWKTPAQPAAKKATDEEEERESKEAKQEAMKPYLATDAVPLVNNKVQWELNIDLPGKKAQQIYDTMLSLMTQMTQEENQLERSKVAIINEQEHSIVATMQEWLTFTANFISLDRTKFNYVLIANCKDGHLQVLLNRISYDYSSQGKEESYKAESWITDKYTVNKKRTRLFPITGKFRRKTIDRKNEIFERITATVKK